MKFCVILLTIPRVNLLCVISDKLNTNSMKQFSWLLMLILAVSACTHKTGTGSGPVEATLQPDTMPEPRGSYYFSGDFRYFADAATFRDCLTNDTFPVVMKGDYHKMEKEYTRMKVDDPEGIYCEVMGYLVNKPAGEEGPDKQILITSLIRFDQTAACHLSSVTDGIYAVYMPDKEDATRKVSLKLNGDYTFQAVVTDLKTKKQVSSVEGVWHRTSDEDIVFLTDGEVYYQGIIDFTTLNLKLYDNNGKLWTFKMNA